MSDRILLLFGAGKYGKDALLNIDKGAYDTILFCDNEESKCGEKLDGIEIISFEELKRQSETELMDIVITCGDCHSINRQLLENGLIRDPEKTKVWNSNLKQITEIERLCATNSYSQQGEDVFLRSFFANKGEEGGICVDIGAHDPFRFSNTYWGYKHGWKCINIEPNPEAFERFNIYRKDDININVGVSDVERDIQYYMFEEPAYNTFDVEFANIYIQEHKLLKKIDVPCKRLDNILNQYDIKNIEYLNIDVENYEMHVLNSNDWTKFRPKLILIEQFVNCINEIASSEIYRFLQQQQYVCKNVIGDTVIYIRAEENHREC